MIEGCIEAQKRGVIATPMLKPSDVLANTHYKSRGTFQNLEIELQQLRSEAEAARVAASEAWAVASAVAGPGHVDYDDEASVFEWAAATAAAMRRVAHG